MKFVAFLLAALLTAAVPAAAQAKNHTCEGEFGTGSGLAGSYIGETCRIAADSDAERAVQKVCKQNSRCRVVALVKANGEFLMIEKVVSVKQTNAPPGPPPYAARLGGFIDGVLAPLPGGCNGATKAEQRVAVLLNAPSGGPAIEMLGRYCAVTNVAGDPPSREKLNATIEARCGAEKDDDALRAGGAGEALTIVLRQDGGAPATLNGTAYMRCPIKRAGTPAWWIDRQPIFQGRVLD